MSLDLSKLQNVVRLPDGRTRARCPACAEAGGDRAGVHLMVFEDGRFGCAAHMGDRAHRVKIYRLAGEGDTKWGGWGGKNRILPRPVAIRRPSWGGWGG